jgi:hypothetical protein
MPPLLLWFWLQFLFPFNRCVATGGAWQPPVGLAQTWCRATLAADAPPL